MAAAAASGHNSSLADNCRPLCSDFNLGAFRSAIFDYRPISLSLPLPLLPASLAPPLVIPSPSCFSSSDVDSDEPARRDQVPPELLARRRDQRRGKGRDLTYGGLVEAGLCGDRRGIPGDEGISNLLMLLQHCLTKKKGTKVKMTPDIVTTTFPFVSD